LDKANIKIARDFEPALGEPRFARRATKSMGGNGCRPRNGFQKIGTSDFGVVIQFRSNLLYQKFLKKRSAALRAAPHPAACAAFGIAPNPAKIFQLRIRARANFFRLGRNFCWIWVLC
jgi:hypothetical protein